MLVVLGRNKGRAEEGGRYVCVSRRNEYINTWGEAGSWVRRGRSNILSSIEAGGAMEDEC